MKHVGVCLLIDFFNRNANVSLRFHLISGDGGFISDTFGRLTP